MNEAVDSDETPAIKAGRKVLDLLPQIAGILVGFLAIAYLTGWQDQSAYFTKLGAPWAVSLLSPTRIMQASTTLVSALAGLSFLGFLLVAEGIVDARRLRLMSLIPITAAIIATTITLALRRWGSPATVYFSSNATAYIWTAFAGLVVSRLIASLVDANLRWQTKHLWLAYFFVLYGIWMVPGQIGAARAERDLVLDETKLATVLTSQAPNGPRWQLVTALESQVLLMQQGNSREDRRFRLVSHADVIGIYAPPK